MAMREPSEGDRLAQQGERADAGIRMFFPQHQFRGNSALLFLMPMGTIMPGRSGMRQLFNKAAFQQSK